MKPKTAKRIPLRLFGVVLILGVILPLWGTIQLGGRLLLPNRTPIGVPPQDLPIEEIQFRSSDNVPLSGWLIERVGAKTGILLMHGSGQNREIMVPRARFLYQAGYSVFLFDFRAHGESGGRFKTFGIGEHEDAEAALALLKERTEVDQVAIIGFSLGGAAAILGPSPVEADAYVLEAVFPTIEQAIANRIKIRLSPLLSWTYPLLSQQIPIRTGTPLSALRPIDQIRRIHQPIFLIAGAEDRRTTRQESQQLFDAIEAKNKQFWIVPGANHTNFHAAAKTSYEKKILEFLASALEASEGL